MTQQQEQTFREAVEARIGIIFGESLPEGAVTPLLIGRATVGRCVVMVDDFAAEPGRGNRLTILSEGAAGLELRILSLGGDNGPGSLTHIDSDAIIETPILPHWGMHPIAVSDEWTAPNSVVGTQQKIILEDLDRLAAAQPDQDALRVPEHLAAIQTWADPSRTAFPLHVGSVAAEVFGVPANG